MSIVSLTFLVFLLITLIVYYIFPKKHRWVILLLASICFFLFSCSWKLLFYVIIGVLASYIGTNILYYKCQTNKSKKIVLLLMLFVILGMLCTLKYINIIPMTLNLFGELFNVNFGFKTFNLVAPLGISYYTLTLTGYVFDVYRGAYSPQKNVFKLLLFTSYYPAMVSGPIMRYPDMHDELYKSSSIDYDNIFMGFERIIYGLMKKMIIADQLALVVNSIFADYATYSGFYIIVGAILYAIQIYADFSGCMDIVIGASKMYGVKLPENFNSPFFSKSLSEFWRRWHISLGLWAKDYIMYPLLKSNFFQTIGKKSKNAFGKKAGKLIPTILAILVLWLLIGLWHGASYQYIFAAGILPWVYLTLSQILEGFNKKMVEILHIKVDCFGYHLFQSIRTILLMCFIWLIVCSPSLVGSFDVICKIFVSPQSLIAENLPVIPTTAIFITCLIVLIVDYLNYKGIDVLQCFKEQNICFKYFVLLFFIVMILLYGAYGPGYDPSQFIYGGF